MQPGLAPLLFGGLVILTNWAFGCQELAKLSGHTLQSPMIPFACKGLRPSLSFWSSILLPACIITCGVRLGHKELYTDSDWDTPDVALISGPGASKGELLDALKTLQINVQKLHEENKALKEENKVLLVEKPKRK
ncbi:hypothetical protein BDR03DRAFT_1010183 [Suillus americanus]|nr:hypothetical protein BDR03DRAFT_1010183 [Suillus americanus]